MNSQTSSEPARIDAPVVRVNAHCERHGAYKAKRIPSPVPGVEPVTMGCPACSEEERERSIARENEARQRAKARKIAVAFERSGIPKRFASRTLGGYCASTDAQRRTLAIAQRYVEGFKPASGASLVLAGKPGTGKTHIACAIANALMERGCTALFGTVLQLIRHVKSTYRKDSAMSENEAINNMLTPDLLIIDEVGAQVGSEHELMILFEIINQRYQECLSTILISNLTHEELTGFLGDRALDRFRECGAVIAFDWSSYRGARNAAPAGEGV